MFLTTALVLVVAFVQVVNAQGDTGASDRGGNESCILPQWNLPKYTHSGSIIRYNSNCEASVLRCYCLTATENSATHSTAGVNFSFGKCIEGCFILTSTVNTGPWLFMGVSMSHSVPHTTDVALFAVSASLTMDLIRTHSPFAASSAPPVQASCHGCSTTYCLPMVH